MEGTEIGMGMRSEAKRREETVIWAAECPLSRMLEA